MEIESERLIAVFDLDGVLVTNPNEALGNGPPITNRDFWDEHWKSPMTAHIQHEMVDMAKALLHMNWVVIILTARPESYRPWTVELLGRVGLIAPSKPTLRMLDTTRLSLVMLPSLDVPQSSAAWKQETVKGWLDGGAKIQFMVEDYRANAEAVRAVVPVLLYERKKPSQWLPAFQCCGGLSRCWCPIDSVTG